MKNFTNNCLLSHPIKCLKLIYVDKKKIYGYLKKSNIKKTDK